MLLSSGYRFTLLRVTWRGKVAAAKVEGAGAELAPVGAGWRGTGAAAKDEGVDEVGMVLATIGLGGRDAGGADVGRAPMGKVRSALLLGRGRDIKLALATMATGRHGTNNALGSQTAGRPWHCTGVLERGGQRDLGRCEGRVRGLGINSGLGTAGAHQAWAGHCFQTNSRGGWQSIDLGERAGGGAACLFALNFPQWGDRGPGGGTASLRSSLEVTSGAELIGSRYP